MNILPCPFCGTTPHYEEDDIIGSMVSCKVCKTDGPWRKGQESHVSIERWNHRPVRPELHEAIKSLRWAVEHLNNDEDEMVEASILTAIDLLEGK